MSSDKSESFNHNVCILKPLIALTGGIGSGKSYVANLLRKRGIPVYDCDAAAKRLMREDEQLKAKLTDLIGPDTYNGGQLQKRVVAEYLLKSEVHKQQLNAVVHPAVANDFLHSGLQWLESAILFESGFNLLVNFQYIVCVTAPLCVRRDRICQRDHISPQQAQQWIEAQWPQEKTAAVSHFIINNDGVQDIDQQLDKILNQII